MEETWLGLDEAPMTFETKEEVSGEGGEDVEYLG